MNFEEIVPLMVIRVLPSSRHLRLRGLVGTVVRVLPSNSVSVSFHGWTGGHHGNEKHRNNPESYWFLYVSDMKDVEVVDEL